MVALAALNLAPTHVLAPSVLHDMRLLLDAAFDGAFTDDDWHHTIGGVHVWLTDAHRVISHGALVERTLVAAGTTLTVGYVEAVATAEAHRRQGHGARVMSKIGELIRRTYPLGALSTGTHVFYETLGWERWRGPTYVDSPEGRRRTPGDDGDVMVLRTPRSPRLDLDGEVVCDWRAGDVW